MTNRAVYFHPNMSFVKVFVTRLGFVKFFSNGTAKANIFTKIGFITVAAGFEPRTPYHKQTMLTMRPPPRPRDW